MPFALDTFTETSDASLINHIPDTGGTWIEKNDDGTGEAIVDSSLDSWKRTLNEAGLNCTYVLSTCPVSNSYRIHYSTASVLSDETSNRITYILGRYNGLPSAGYGFLVYNPINAADKQLFKRIDGTNTQLASTDNGTVSGDTFDIDVLPGSQICYKNGAIIMQSADTAASVTGRAGMGLGDLFSTGGIRNTWRLDDFQIDEFNPYPGVVLRKQNQTVYRM